MVVDMVSYRATVGAFCATHTRMKLTVKILVVTIHTNRPNNKKSYILLKRYIYVFI